MKLVSVWIAITLLSSSIHFILSPNIYPFNQSISFVIGSQPNKPPVSNDGGSRFSKLNNQDNSEYNSDTILTL